MATNILEICKTPNINHIIIKDLLISKNNINSTYFGHILENFRLSDEENIENNLKCIKYFIKYITNDEIILVKKYINILVKKYIYRKNIVSLLKAFSIYCNKFLEELNHLYDSRIILLINALKSTTNKKRIVFYVGKINNYINKNKISSETITLLGKIIYTDTYTYTYNDNLFLFLRLINKIKKINQNYDISNLEKLLYDIDKNIYNYVYFLKNKNNLISDKTQSIEFVSKLGYSHQKFNDIDILNLKRGFIHGLKKHDKNYLLKFQPNKSLMEITINCFLKSKNYDNFLTPEYFFVNNDNSYFYIIQKYSTDLYNFFNKLEDNNKILSFDDILKIIYFLMKSIRVLHSNNIIHSDLKLENIVINYNDAYDIQDIKIIDFDVALFNKIPESISESSKPYEKVFNNKKPRGTRIYMIKNQEMSFKNDIFSLGVVIMVILYKNLKLDIAIKKNNLKLEPSKNKKLIIKYNGIIKKINLLKDDIENIDTKIKILEIIEKNNNYDKNKFKVMKEFILNCLKTELDINEMFDKYEKYF